MQKKGILINKKWQKKNIYKNPTQQNAKNFLLGTYSKRSIKSVTYKQKPNSKEVYMNITLVNGEKKKGFYTDESNKTSFIK